MSNGFSRQEAAQACCPRAGRGYREAMRRFAEQGNLAVWYARLDMDEVVTAGRATGLDAQRRSWPPSLDKARSRDSVQALAKLTTVVDGRPRILSRPPLLVPVEELSATTTRSTGSSTSASCTRPTAGRSSRTAGSCWSSSSWSRWPARSWASAASGRAPGSCSSRASTGGPAVPAGQGGGPSVLSRLRPRSQRFKNQGERVVHGQRLMQAVSDIFLGWHRGPARTASSGTSTCASSATGRARASSRT